MQQLWWRMPASLEPRLLVCRLLSRASGPRQGRGLRWRGSWRAALLIAGLPAGAYSLSAGELLDCDGDPEWASFRLRLQENAAQGYPLDVELVAQAQDLLQVHHGALMLDPGSAYGASQGMLSFFSSCNAAPSSPEASALPFCLYGAVAALWVVARAGHPDRRSLLAHAEFMLGKTMRNTLDFMESSRWPLNSLDVLANLQRAPEEDFRLPAELGHYRPPMGDQALPSRASPQQVLVPAADARVRIVIWEVGVHASLSAEPLQMWARFVPRAEFAHRNLIQDQYPKWLPDKCQTLYNHPRLSCDIVKDDITEVFRKRIPNSATSKDPIESIDDFAAEFRSVVGERLAKVDAFLCTVAYLCLLVDSLDLPVLGYFGHPLLFMVPHDSDTRVSFWSRFATMMNSQRVAFAVSDPFLQMQFEYQVGAPRLPAIRTHALYTGATHFPARPHEVLVMDRPHECVLMCIIQRLLPRREADNGQEGGTDSWPTKDGRLRSARSSDYPYSFLTRALTDRSFSTFAQFRAVLLWAYDMDLITFYEFYSMNTPIFMPSHLPKYLFQQDHMDYDGRWSKQREETGRPQMWPGEAFGASPFDEGNLDAVRFTVGFSDYFRFPEVQYFDSIPHLLERLPQTDFFEVVQRMARFNQDSLIESSNAWRALLRRTTGWDADVLQL